MQAPVKTAGHASNDTMLRNKKGTDRRVRQQTQPARNEDIQRPTSPSGLARIPKKYSPNRPLMHNPRRRHPDLHSHWMWGGPNDQGRNELTPTPTEPPKNCLPPPQGAPLANNRIPENVRRRELTHKHPALASKKAGTPGSHSTPPSPNVPLKGGGSS